MTDDELLSLLEESRAYERPEKALAAMRRHVWLQAVLGNKPASVDDGDAYEIAHKHPQCDEYVRLILSSIHATNGLFSNAFYLHGPIRYMGYVRHRPLERVFVHVVKEVFEVKEGPTWRGSQCIVRVHADPKI